MTPTLHSEKWLMLSPYLDEALSLEEDARSTWLSWMRSQNAEVARALDELLTVHRVLTGEGFLENGYVELPMMAGLAGQTVGGYRLASQLAHGEMSSVWLAERADGKYERQVVVKLLNIALMGKFGQEQLKREGRILGLLTHAHIAKLIDTGVSQTGQPYLILEYVDGDHIDRHCDHHKLTIRARVRLFLDVLDAVSEAHANLIVHRDIKPSNVLVGKDGQVKLLDFGIARLLENEGSPEVALRRAMTPEYAAPEQLKGEGVTRATDIYAVGILLYRLLTGLHPTGMGSQTPADLIRAIVEIEPGRPSELATSNGVSTEIIAGSAASRASTPDKLRRLLRGDLDAIVAKALKKNPAERYSSVAAFAGDLFQYLKSAPISDSSETITFEPLKL